MRQPLLGLLVFAFVAPSAVAATGPEKPMVRVGSKKFTESVILGEIVAHLARHAGCEVVHRRELGGTRVVWNALLGSEIDVYIEYTGTLSKEIFAGKGLGTDDDLQQALADRGIRMSRPLLYRADLVEQAPQAAAMIRRLEGQIPEKWMIAMNGRAKLVREPEAQVAAGFVEDLLDVSVTVREVSVLDRFLRRTGEHLTIVGISLAAAVIVAVPLGIAAAKPSWAPSESSRPFRRSRCWCS